MCWARKTRQPSRGPKQTSPRASSRPRRRSSSTGWVVPRRGSSLPPPKDSMPIYVVGVNFKEYKAMDTVVSIASCTTQCSTQFTMVVHEKFGMMGGLMTMMHAMTATQHCTATCAVRPKLP
mmetsp:Transcript_2167/g.5415  ORF Transcript_2167/g.5415 Transcript_2167/m.5415 type:complete len:121 (-) Transcript_2167:160-522(-)